MSQSRGYHPSGNSDFKSCCDFKHLFLTNKSADSHCKKETNSVWVDKSNCRFIYLYVFYRTVFHRFVSQPMNLEKSDNARSCRGFVGALGNFLSVS